MTFRLFHIEHGLNGPGLSLTVLSEKSLTTANISKSIGGPSKPSLTQQFFASAYMYQIAPNDPLRGIL